MTKLSLYPVIPENFGAIAEKFIRNPGEKNENDDFLKKVKKHLLPFCNIF